MWLLEVVWLYKVRLNMVLVVGKRSELTEEKKIEGRYRGSGNKTA